MELPNEARISSLRKGSFNIAGHASMTGIITKTDPLYTLCDKLLVDNKFLMGIIE